MAKAIIIIDVQNGFVDKKVKDLPERIANYIKQTHYDYILFTQFINHKNTNFVKKLGWKKCFSSPNIDIHPTLHPFITNNNLFSKDTYSAFKSKELLAFIKDKKITRFDLCGLDAEACVLSSAFEGFDLGFDITVLTDLINCSKKSLVNYTYEVISRNIQK